MKEEVAVIGGGIVGLAAAWREAVGGHDVTLFERDRIAQGASVRNFGMVWPIGQSAEHFDTALCSRSLWKELVADAGLWNTQTGSLFVARRDDEWQVLNEFADSASVSGYRCQLLTPKQVADHCDAVEPIGLLGGLYSETEMGVDPREVIAQMPRWLADRFGVALEYETTIQEIELPKVVSSDGRNWLFDRVTIASGADFATLYPEVFAEHALAKCKLQMMRTVPQPQSWNLGPHLASGLTLRHYASFRHCNGLAALRDRVARETPEVDTFGIHVMAAQNGSGEVVLGDSHAYGDAITPFDSEQITDLMLRELQEFMRLPRWQLSARWHGIYAIRSDGDIQFVHRPQEGVTIVIATGGCGMTMSFGLAEKRVKDQSQSSSVAGDLA